MPTTLSIKALLARDDLLALTDARLQEAGLLRTAGHYAASIYLAGLAVECCLKAAICKSLDWDVLLGAFQTHDLEGLLKYCGYDRQLRTNPEVLDNFNRLAKRWAGVETSNDVRDPGSVRYKLIDAYDARKADDFFRWVSDPETGVIPWLQSRMG